MLQIEIEGGTSTETFELYQELERMKNKIEYLENENINLYKELINQNVTQEDKSCQTGDSGFDKAAAPAIVSLKKTDSPNFGIVKIKTKKI